MAHRRGPGRGMMMRLRRLRWFPIAMLSSACGAGADDTSGSDSGVHAPSVMDAGRPEAGAPDAASEMDPDARRPDAGAPDAASEMDPDAAVEVEPDASARDAASEMAPDARRPDAGAPDAAVQVDPDTGVLGAPCVVDGADGVCLERSACPEDHHPTPGHCSGPAEVQCCTEGPPPEPGVCDAAQLQRPAALPPEAPGEAGCPPGMAAVEAFCVDRYEAALVELTPGGEVPWSPYHNPGDRPMRAVSVAGVVPQGYVNGLQAAAACAEAGKRLCDDREWLRACQGPDMTTYPYGDARQPGVCNDARAQHPAVELFPNDPNPFDRIQDACINQLPASLDETGANPGCVSAEGLFDLMGNLHEWTADPEGTFRGGFYVDTAINGPGCLYRTTAHNTAHWDYSTGFRCCAEPNAR